MARVHRRLMGMNQKAPRSGCPMMPCIPSSTLAQLWASQDHQDQAFILAVRVFIVHWLCISWVSPSKSQLQHLRPVKVNFDFLDKQYGYRHPARVGISNLPRQRGWPADCGHGTLPADCGHDERATGMRHWNCLDEKKVRSQCCISWVRMDDMKVFWPNMPRGTPVEHHGESEWNIMVSHSATAVHNFDVWGLEASLIQWRSSSFGQTHLQCICNGISCSIFAASQLIIRDRRMAYTGNISHTAHLSARENTPNQKPFGVQNNSQYIRAKT